MNIMGTQQAAPRAAKQMMSASDLHIVVGF